MTERLKTLHLTEEQITLLFYMAGYSYSHLPTIYKKTYDELMNMLSLLTREV